MLVSLNEKKARTQFLIGTMKGRIEGIRQYLADASQNLNDVSLLKAVENDLVLINYQILYFKLEVAQALKLIEEVREEDRLGK